MYPEFEILKLPSMWEATAEQRRQSFATMGLDIEFGGTVRFFAAPEWPTQIIMEGKNNGY